MRPDYIIHTPAEIVRIRRAAKMAAEARERICSLVRSGMTTWDLDELAGEVIRSTGGTPTFLGYRGFPGNICISINDEVVHGLVRRQNWREGQVLRERTNDLLHQHRWEGHL